jgi:hypothetical protein
MFLNTRIWYIQSSWIILAVEGDLKRVFVLSLHQAADDVCHKRECPLYMRCCYAHRQISGVTFLLSVA